MKNKFLVDKTIIFNYFGTKSFFNCIIDMTRKNKNEKKEIK